MFDASHGQANWSQTGFTSREMHTNFAGVMETLCRLGCRCRSSRADPFLKLLPTSRLLVIPPPTGRYDKWKQRWRPLAASLFTATEISDTLAFLREGGSLLAFAYRFGDSFTRTNLGELFDALKCQLNDDAVLDIPAVRKTHPLQMEFSTQRKLLLSGWPCEGVEIVRWRPMATFTILPEARARPLALSAGGRCLSFNRTLRQISFESLPLAVAGYHGRGRFALFGGPHAFETSEFGLLNVESNRRFLENILRWLLAACDDMGETRTSSSAEVNCFGNELSRVQCRGEGKGLIEEVERVLKRTGVLKALNRAKWIP